MLQDVWDFRLAVSVEVSMNMIPQTMVLLPTRNNLRLAGDNANKLKANREHTHANEPSAIGHRQGWRRDCTQMLELL
jgi:hypothetical protein